MSAGNRTSAGYNLRELKGERGTMSEERNIEQIEQDMEKVAATIERLQHEAQRISDRLSLGQEPSVLVEAALSGKSPATSASTLKDERRKAEIEATLIALANRADRLALERVGLLEAEHAADIKQAGERVAAARAAADQAIAERDAAHNEAQWTKERGYTLREQRQRLESRLWQNDPEYRQEQQALVEQRRAEAEMTPEQVEAYQRQLAEAGGAVLYDTPEQF